MSKTIFSILILVALLLPSFVHAEVDNKKLKKKSSPAATKNSKADKSAKGKKVAEKKSNAPAKKPTKAEIAAANKAAAKKEAIRISANKKAAERRVANKREAIKRAEAKKLTESLTAVNPPAVTPPGFKPEVVITNNLPALIERTSSSKPVESKPKSKNPLVPFVPFASVNASGIDMSKLPRSTTMVSLTKDAVMTNLICSSGYSFHLTTVGRHPFVFTTLWYRDNELMYMADVGKFESVETSQLKSLREDDSNLAKKIISTVKPRGMKIRPDSILLEKPGLNPSDVQAILIIVREHLGESLELRVGQPTETGCGLSGNNS